MKLRYFIPIVVALVAMFTGCSEDNDPIYLDNIRLSSTYVSLSKDGATTDVSLTTAAEWSIDEKTVPEWLTISPMSGAAGTHTLTFTPTPGGSRTATLKINCGGQTQEVNVIQYAEETEPVLMTVSEAVAHIKAGTQPEGAVYVKGIVCKIQEISPQYGNATYFLSDDGTYGDNNWLEIYRGAWLNNEKFTTGDEFAVGDEMVVKGVLIDYNGTPETQQGTAEVISITKSLIKVDSLVVDGVKSDGVLPVEGGDITAMVSCKGDGINVEIPADAKDWLFMSAVTTKTITFRALPNVGGDRSTVVTFKTISGSKEYSSQVTISQKGAIIECSIADFLAAPVGDTQYRITGVITKVAKAEYGNIYVKDYSGETYVYGVGAKGDFEKLGLKVGDIVTLVGKRSAYKEDPQMGGGQYEKHISVTEISLADFLTKPDDKNVYYMVTGTVKDLLSSAGKENDYGNLHLTDGTNELYVYGCYPGYGAPKGDAQKGFIKAAGIKVGDKLTMIGYKDTYNGLIELCGGTYFSHESAE